MDNLNKEYSSLLSDPQEFLDQKLAEDDDHEESIKSLYEVISKVGDVQSELKKTQD